MTASAKHWMISPQRSTQRQGEIMAETSGPIEGIGDDPDRVPHDHVVTWVVHAEDTEGDFESTVGRTTVSDEAGELAEVSVYASPTDGSLVVEVITAPERTLRLRMHLNELDTPVYDRIVTP
jgi:hypothetical protein